MTDTSNTIKKYNRDVWTLEDLRTIVTDTANETTWPDATPVRIDGSPAGTVEVIGAE